MAQTSIHNKRYQIVLSQAKILLNNVAKLLSKQKSVSKFSPPFEGGCVCMCHKIIIDL